MLALSASSAIPSFPLTLRQAEKRRARAALRRYNARPIH